MWRNPKNPLCSRTRYWESFNTDETNPRIGLIFFIFISCVCFLSPSAVRSHIVINEIYYDHPGSDSGFEFVELFNPGSSSVPLFDMSLQFHNGASTGWETIWTGQVGDSIESGNIYVIGESSVIPFPDDIVGLNLQNGPDALRLLAGSAVLDLVGYGELDDPVYCEGVSAPKVPSGSSLGRKPDGKDSDDNNTDFAVMSPSPGRFNQPRWDVSVGISQELLQKLDLRPDRPVQILFFVTNEGLFDIDEFSLQVSVWDSTETVCAPLFTSTNQVGLKAGHRLSFETAAYLSDGYHWLICRVNTGSDEREENDEAVVVVRVGMMGVLISEVMSYPTEGCPQYLEIFNGRMGDIDLAGWSVKDRSHSPSPFPADSLICPPGAYFVLTDDREELLTCFPLLLENRVIQPAGSWPYLNHSGSKDFADSVIVMDAFGIVVDRVAYPPQGSDHRGRSLERIDLYPGEGPHVWILSTSAGGGSPGSPAETMLNRPPEPMKMNVHPNPFSPGTGESLVIELGWREGEGTAVVSIFDIHGLKIKTVGTTSQFPAVFVWDGKREGHDTVETGIYIVTCAFHAVEGGENHVERVVVGWGRRTH